MIALHRFFPLFLFLFLLTATAAECATQMTVDPATGLPSSITDPQITAAGVIAAPVSLKLRKNDRNGPELAVSAVNKTGTDTYALTLSDPDFSMELKYGQTEFPYLEWSVENKSSEAKNCYATFSLTMPAAADRSFFPAAENAKLVLTQGMEPVSYAYAYGFDDLWPPGILLALPLGQVYSSGSNWGLAFFGEYGNQIEKLEATVSRASEKPLAELSLNMYQLKAGEKAVRRLYFAVTKGDWRPALGALQVRYRQGLEPRNPDVAKLAPFVGGCLDPKWIASDDTSVMERWHREGGRAVEIHCTFPFYGQYVSEKEPWTGIVDDQWRIRVLYNETWRTPPMPSTNASWQDVMAWMELQHDFLPTMTVEKINNYLERLHSHGMTSLIYWNPSDAWGIWANEKFPNDIAPNGCNGLVTDNRTGCGMKHDKESAWGVYILNQLKEQLRIYPKADGVFFDIAMFGGHNLTELCREACDYVHDKGKICWWNGPYNMELAALADGLMDEGGGEPDGRYRLATEKIQYYGLLGKPIISIGQYTYAQYVVPGYAEMLVHGVTPQPISNNSPWLHIDKEQQEDIRAHWSPLFKWLHGRRWVLDAHALETTAGVEANIFRTPDDNLVVPVVSDPFPTDTSNPLFNIGVTVRLPDIGEVRGVYLLTPDLLGYHQLPFTLTGGVLQTTIPRLQKAGMLVLAKKGIFPSFLQGSLTLVRGQQGTLYWTVDNWTDQTKLVPMSLETPSGRQGTVMKVKPGKNPVSLSLPVTIPAENTDSRFVVTASAKVDGEELGGKMELWNDPPLLVLTEAPDHIRADEELTLTVQLLGHFTAAKTVKVNVSSPGWQFDAAEKSVTLPQNQQTVIEVEFKGHPLVTGQTSIAIAAETEDQTVSGGAAKSVDVWATTIPADPSTIESAELIFDSFGADGGEKSLKPLSVNGVLIGNVPSSIDGDQWYKGHVMQLLPEVVAALQQSNEIRIDNTVQDRFKVRNFQLRLHLQSGITVESYKNVGVYTGCTGWAYGEGTQFLCGEPLTGIMVNFAE